MRDSPKDDVLLRSFECTTICEDLAIEQDALERRLPSKESLDSIQEKHERRISHRSQDTHSSADSSKKESQKWRSLTKEEREAKQDLWRRHSNFSTGSNVQQMHEMLVNQWQSSSRRPSRDSHNTSTSGRNSILTASREWQQKEGDDRNLSEKSSKIDSENCGILPKTISFDEQIPTQDSNGEINAKLESSPSQNNVVDIEKRRSGRVQTALQKAAQFIPQKMRSRASISVPSPQAVLRAQKKEEWRKEDEAEQESIAKTYENLPWIHTARAQTFFGTVIAVNALCLALETDLHATDGFSWGQSQDVLWLVIESMFLMLFTSELSLRLKADGLQTFKDPWNCLDLLLICTGFLDAWVLQVILAGAFDFFNASFLRIMRLLRLARIAKVFRFFRVLYLLIEGILNAMRMIIWFVMLLVLMLFVFGIFCTTTFGRDEVNPVKHFSSVPISMFTLFQLVTLEGWPGIYQEASQGHPAMWIFFILFIFVANMVMLNMMTGVIVENVLTIARDEEKDRDRTEQQKRSAAMTKLKRVFELLDQDESGMLCREELEFLRDDEDAQEQLKGLNIPAAQIMKLFDQMDFGGSGEISLEEFIDCCLRYSQGGMAERDLLQVHWDLRRHVQQTIKEQMQELQGDMKNHKEKWFQQLELVLNETRHQVQLVVQHADALSKQNREGRALGPESGSLECQIRSPQHASKSGEQRSTSSEQRWRSPEQQNGSLEKRSRSNPRNVIQQPDAWEEQSVPPIERHDKRSSIL